jgi:hypothetical protein
LISAREIAINCHNKIKSDHIASEIKMRIKFCLIAFSLLVFLSLPFAHLHAATDSWQAKLKTFKATNGVFVKHKYEEVEFWRGPCWNPDNKATMGILQSNWSYNSEHAAFDLTVSGFPKDPVLGGYSGPQFSDSLLS